MKANDAKVGDYVKFSNKINNLDEAFPFIGKIFKVNKIENGMFVLEGCPHAYFSQTHNAWSAGRFDKADPPTPVLDLTKPLQFRSGEAVELLGKAVANIAVTDGSRIYLRYPSGRLTACVDAPGDVINVPPPAKWPKKLYIILFERSATSKPQGKQGKAMCEVQTDKDIAERQAKFHADHGHTVLGIQEVDVDPKEIKAS